MGWIQEWGRGKLVRMPRTEGSRKQYPSQKLKWNQEWWASHIFLLSQVSMKLTKYIFCHSIVISSSYRKHWWDQHSVQTRISDFSHLWKTTPRNNVSVGKLIPETQEKSVLMIPSYPQFFPHLSSATVGQILCFLDCVFFFNIRFFYICSLFTYQTFPIFWQYHIALSQ